MSHIIATDTMKGEVTYSAQSLFCTNSKHSDVCKAVGEYSVGAKNIQLVLVPLLLQNPQCRVARRCDFASCHESGHNLGTLSFSRSLEHTMLVQQLCNNHNWIALGAQVC